MVRSHSPSPVPYILRQLRRNPLDDAGEVLAERRRILGVKPVVSLPVSLDEIMEQRARARQRLEQLRSRFWDASLDQLRRALAVFDTSRFPEMEPAVNRLRLAAACRGEFARLAAAPGSHMGLFRAFKTAVILPSSDAGPIKERFLHTLTTRGKLNKAKNSVRMLKSHFPTLYKMEADWFETILRVRAPRDVASVSEPGGAQVPAGGGSFPVPSWLIVVVFMIVARLLLYFCMRLP